MNETTQSLMARRERLLGPNVRLFYEEPLHLVKGEGAWVWDAEGRRYLDCYNNVPHVGHCHPHVVDAICKQAAALNTHTRYLHEGILGGFFRDVEISRDSTSEREHRGRVPPVELVGCITIVTPHALD